MKILLTTMDIHEILKNWFYANYDGNTAKDVSVSSFASVDGEFVAAIIIKDKEQKK